jgi:hypothetical protein
MEEVSQAYQTAKEVGSSVAIVAGIFGILRLLLRAITGSVSIRENTLQQYLIRSLEAASSATEAASTATKQAQETRELLADAVEAIRGHTAVMERLIIVLNTQHTQTAKRATSNRRAAKIG